MQSSESSPQSATETISPTSASPEASHARRKRKKVWFGVLIAILVTGTVFWWQTVLLSPLEHQLVGKWTGTRHGREGRLLCEFREDRSGDVTFEMEPIGPRLSSPPGIHLKQPIWRASQGRLFISETVSPWVRVQLFWFRLSAMVTGGASTLPQSLGMGEIRDVHPDSFELGEWHMQRVSGPEAPSIP